MSDPCHSSKRNVATNAIMVWLGFLTQIGVAFFMSPVLVHGLGDSSYGIWSLVESILSYLMLFDIGLGISLVRYVARFDANHDQAALNRLFSTCLCLFSGLGLVVLLIVSGLALCWPSAQTGREFQLVLLLLGANLGFQLPLGVFPSILDGLGRYPTKILVQTLGLAVRTVLFLMAIRSGGGLLALALITTICTVLEHLLLALAAWCYLPGLKFSTASIDLATFRSIRGYSLDAFWIMLANRVSFQTDAIVIGAFLAPSFITFFAVAARLVEYAKNGFRSAVTVLTPAISDLQARGEHPTICRLMVRSTRTVLYLVAPIQVGLLLLGHPFLALWLGPAYADASFPTLVVLAIPLALATAQSVSVRTLYGLGQIRWLARAALLQAVVNLLLSVALVRPLGIVGVALGTTIPNLLYCLAVAVYVCRALEIPFFSYLLHTSLRPFLLSGIPAALWAVTLHCHFIDTWFRLILSGALGVAAYAIPALVLEIGVAAGVGRFAKLCRRRLAPLLFQ